MLKSFLEFQSLEENIKGESNRILARIKRLKGKVNPEVLEVAIDIFEFWLRIQGIRKR